MQGCLERFREKILADWDCTGKAEYWANRLGRLYNYLSIQQLLTVSYKGPRQTVKPLKLNSFGIRQKKQEHSQEFPQKYFGLMDVSTASLESTGRERGSE